MGHRIKNEDGMLVLWGRFFIPHDLLFFTGLGYVLVGFVLLVVGAATHNFLLQLPVVLTIFGVVAGLVGWALVALGRAWWRVLRGQKPLEYRYEDDEDD